jgi:hypothetical protein
VFTVSFTLLIQFFPLSYLSSFYICSLLVDLADIPNRRGEEGPDFIAASFQGTASERFICRESIKSRKQVPEMPRIDGDKEKVPKAKKCATARRREKKRHNRLLRNNRPPT